MNEIRIRYTGKNCSNKIIQKIFTIREIEDAQYWGWIVEENILPDSVQRDRFTGLQDRNKIDLYENDIVKVLTDREVKYGGRQSQYDMKVIESRSIIIFKDFKWQLDVNNDFNNAITKLKGKETEERRLTLRTDLSSYNFFQNNEWNQKHNAGVYWLDIEKIGDIHMNPELLRETVK